MRLLLPLSLLAAACGPSYVVKPGGFDEDDGIELATKPFGDDDDHDDPVDETETSATEEPLDPTLDSDVDGVIDVIELPFGGAPYNPDSDGDGWEDGGELDLGSHPLDSSSAP